MKISNYTDQADIHIIPDQTDGSYSSEYAVNSAQPDEDDVYQEEDSDSDKERDASDDSDNVNPDDSESVAEQNEDEKDSRNIILDE